MRTPSIGTRLYTATIHGTWNPGGIAPLDEQTFPHVQLAAADATRQLLGVDDNEIEFHLVATTHSGGAVYRSRWRVQASAFGPTLRLGTRDEHDAQVTLTMQVDSFAHHLQVVADEDMPYRGVFSGVIPALLLRHHWGTEARRITISGAGTGTFTPRWLSYPERHGHGVITVAHDTEHLPDYGFAEHVGSTVQPAVWLVTDDLRAAWKVSYCVPDLAMARSDRWDDPAQPVPDFTPLDWPAQERAFVWPTNTGSAE